MKLAEVTSDDPRFVDCQRRYFQEISIRFSQAFDPTAGESSGITGAQQWHVLAMVDDEPVGCGTLRDLGNAMAEVKRVWVSQNVRGVGLGLALMDWLEERAESEGFEAVRLDTNQSLIEAQALYRKRGYLEIPRYNENPFADHFFEKRFVRRAAPDIG